MDVVTKPEHSNIISITRMKKLWKVKAIFYLDAETAEALEVGWMEFRSWQIKKMEARYQSL